jgi:hypothetical protein
MAVITCTTCKATTQSDHAVPQCPACGEKGGVFQASTSKEAGGLGPAIDTGRPGTTTFVDTAHPGAATPPHLKTTAALAPAAAEHHGFVRQAPVKR